MPTAAKLIAALCLGALGYAVSEILKLVLSESIDYGWFSFVNLAVGLVVGWRVVGSRAGRGMSAAISNGFTGMVALVFWGLFIQACNTMVDQAMRHMYDGPVEALADIFQIGAEYAMQMTDVRVVLTLLCGGIVTGIFAEVVAGRWR